MDFTTAISTILPWILFAMLIYFTMLLISYLVAIRQAKRKDNTLQVCFSSRGKMFLIIEVIIYIILLCVSITMFVNSLKLKNNLTNSISVFNFLTIYTLLFSLHVQDIIFVGKKNILIGNSMYEYRRMKKVNYPKKNKLQFVYGQKEITISLLFTDITELKTRLQKAK